ncbi:MAG: hypothetical protein ACR2OJ_00665 [Hyphomicrobiales bacterium]
MIVKLAPAKEIFDGEDYQTYRSLLKQLKCDEAISLLNKAFVAHYPQYNHAAEPDGRTYSDWKALAMSHYYPEASFCSSVEYLEIFEDSAKREGKPLGLFVEYVKRWSPPSNYNDAWSSRDSMIGGIVDSADHGHHPALIELAKLHQRGDVFEAGPEAEYYLLKPACHCNVRCEEIMPRIAELEAKLPPDLQREVAAKAMKDEFDHKAMGLTADE